MPVPHHAVGDPEHGWAMVIDQRVELSQRQRQNPPRSSTFKRWCTKPRKSMIRSHPLQLFPAMEGTYFITAEGVVESKWRPIFNQS
jgi:hypothetical protein